MSTKTVDGHKIELTPQFTFRVTGPLVSDPERPPAFASMAEAEAKIVSWRKAEAAEKRVKMKPIPALAPDGGKVNVTGVNTRTGKMNGANEHTYIWPDVPWIEEALKRKTALEAEAREIFRKLLPARIETRTGYGSLDAEHYAERIGYVKRAFAEAEAAAKKLAPQ